MGDEIDRTPGFGLMGGFQEIRKPGAYLEGVGLLEGEVDIDVTAMGKFEMVLMGRDCEGSHLEFIGAGRFPVSLYSDRSGEVPEPHIVSIPNTIYAGNISRLQAALTRSGREGPKGLEYQVVDFGSITGTWVRGKGDSAVSKRIGEDYPTEPNDILRDLPEHLRDDYEQTLREGEDFDFEKDFLPKLNERGYSVEEREILSRLHSGVSRVLKDGDIISLGSDGNNLDFSYAVRFVDTRVKVIGRTKATKYFLGTDTNLAHLLDRYRPIAIPQREEDHALNALATYVRTDGLKEIIEAVDALEVLGIPKEEVDDLTASSLKNRFLSPALRKIQLDANLGRMISDNQDWKDVLELMQKKLLGAYHLIREVNGLEGYGKQHKS